ncbi:MAG: hypothetical protein WC661_00025 [Opitutaceae bacterium]|jgi:hypothetical protein
MKTTTISAWGMMALTLIGSAVLSAQTNTTDHAGKVVVLGASAGRDQTPYLSAMSEGELTVEVLLPASVDRSKIVVAMRQVAGGLTLPLVDVTPLEKLLVGASPDEHGITSVRIAIPKLTRKTLVLVGFSLKGETSPSLGQARVVVYPPLDWAPLARHLKKEGPQLLVFGRDTGLREFLKAREIKFSDLGKDLPERLENDTLAVGFASVRAWEEGKSRFTAEGGRLLVFVDDPVSFPGVYVTPLGAGAVTKVTLPALSALEGDPRSQNLFFQLIEQQLNPATIANP